MTASYSPRGRVAASAATAVAPEQAAVWAYLQPHFSLGEIAFTLTGALPGRVHLSGFLDRMSPERFDLVRSGLSVYKALRSDIPHSLPFWPLGLPSWEDTWIAAGWRGEAEEAGTWLVVWRREAGDKERGGVSRPGDRHGVDDGTRTVTISHLRGTRLRPTVLYPGTSDASVAWEAGDGQLTVSLPRANTAVLLRLGAEAPAPGRQV